MREGSGQRMRLPRLNRYGSVKKLGRYAASWQTLVSCVARVSRLTYIKDTRSGLWATREEVGYYPCQTRHGAKVLGCAIRAH